MINQKLGSFAILVLILLEAHEIRSLIYQTKLPPFQKLCDRDPDSFGGHVTDTKFTQVFNHVLITFGDLVRKKDLSFI